VAALDGDAVRKFRSLCYLHTVGQPSPCSVWQIQAIREARREERRDKWRRWMDAFPDEAEQMSKEADWPLTSIPDRWKFCLPSPFPFLLSMAVMEAEQDRNIGWSRAV